MALNIRKPAILSRPLDLIFVTILGIGLGYYIWKPVTEEHFKKQYQKQLEEIEKSRL